MIPTSIAVIQVHSECPNGDDGDDGGKVIEVEGFIEARLMLISLRSQGIADGYELIHDEGTELTLGKISPCGGHTEIHARLFIEETN